MNFNKNKIETKITDYINNTETGKKKAGGKHIKNAKWIESPGRKAANAAKHLALEYVDRLNWMVKQAMVDKRVPDAVIDQAGDLVPARVIEDWDEENKQCTIKVYIKFTGRGGGYLTTTASGDIGGETNMTINYDNKYVFFNGEEFPRFVDGLSRHSLVTRAYFEGTGSSNYSSPYTGEGVDNIVALYNDGYQYLGKHVFGYFTSPTLEEPRLQVSLNAMAQKNFMQDAVSALETLLSSDPRMEDNMWFTVTLSDEYDHRVGDPMEIP